MDREQEWIEELIEEHEARAEYQRILRDAHETRESG